MARMRYNVSQKKKEVRDTYDEMTRREKRKHSQIYKDTGDLDNIQCEKRKSKTTTDTKALDGVFKTRDQMLIDWGWRPAHAKTDFGIRQEQRADTVIAWCEKMEKGAKDWIRPHKKCASKKSHNSIYIYIYILEH